MVNLYVKKAQDQARGFRSIINNERNYAKEYEGFLKSYQIRPSQDSWNTFLDRYKDATKELRSENFHHYIQHKGLGHHLSETQIIERNRENQGLNAYGLMSNLAPVAMTLGAMVGMNYLTNKGFNNGIHRAENDWYENLRENPNFVARQESLSGENSHYEALPQPHIGGESHIVPSHLGFGEAQNVYTGGMGINPNKESMELNPSFPSPQELDRLQKQREYYMGDTGSYL